MQEDDGALFGLDLKTLLNLVKDQRVAAPCAIATVAGTWIVVKNALSMSKCRGKKLPPVYNKGLILPFFGAATQFLWDPLELGARGHATYGDIFTVYVFGKRLTFICGPEAQEFFCKANDEDVSQQNAYKFSVPLFGEGVIYGADAERARSKSSS